MCTEERREDVASVALVFRWKFIRLEVTNGEKARAQSTDSDSDLGSSERQSERVIIVLREEYIRTRRREGKKRR